MHITRATLIFIVSIALSCSASDPTSPGSTSPETHTSEYPEPGIVHLSSFLSWDSEKITEAARAKVFIAPLEFCCSPHAPEVLDELKRLNPEITILGFLSVLGVAVLWSDTFVVRQKAPFAYEYYQAVKDDWVYTTTGDTLMLWPDVVFLNPIESGQINRTMLDEMVDVIEKYQAISGNIVDGIVHDYFMDGPYINMFIRKRVEGEIDLDSDGSIFAEDPSERELLISFQKEYVREIRRRLGNDFIQIGNGLLQHADSEMASLLNGIYYEDFPNCRIGLTDRDGFLRLLDHHAEGYLTEARGRTWSIVTNELGSGNNLFCLVASMLAGCVYTELHGKYLFTGWTLDIHGGDPFSAMLREGRADSLLTFRKKFRYGEARISFDASGRRREVVFEHRGTPGD